MMMNNISPRPWHITLYRLYDKNGMEVELYDFDEYYENVNLEYMLKCVNEHDSLVEEVKFLKSEIEKAKNIMIKFGDKAESEVERLKQESERLCEALKKCNPFTPSTGSRGYLCEFCLDNPHTEDCEYIKLTEGKDA